MTDSPKPINLEGNSAEAVEAGALARALFTAVFNVARSIDQMVEIDVFGDEQGAVAAVVLDVQNRLRQPDGPAFTMHLVAALATLASDATAVASMFATQCGRDMPASTILATICKARSQNSTQY
jgi:hypothetical protein